MGKNRSARVGPVHGGYRSDFRAVPGCAELGLQPPGGRARGGSTDTTTQIRAIVHRVYTVYSSDCVTARHSRNVDSGFRPRLLPTRSFPTDAVVAAVFLPPTTPNALASYLSLSLALSLPLSVNSWPTWPSFSLLVFSSSSSSSSSSYQATILCLCIFGLEMELFFFGNVACNKNIEIFRIPVFLFAG